MNKTKKKAYMICLWTFLCIGYVLPTSPGDIDYTVIKIWDKAPHNAFTDLIKFKGRYYCAFREGTGHIPAKDGSGDGEIRVLVSDDGVTWKSAVLLTKKGFDLRDAKLSVTPDGRLMVLMGGTIYEKAEFKSRIPHVSFSDRKGENFSDPQPLAIDENIRSNTDWLWRVTWHKKTGYGVIYQLSEDNEWSVYLVKTTDGINYQSVTKLDVAGKPNEATVDFTRSGEMRILIRREAADRNGLLGVSPSPYKDWRWTDLGIRLGGPHLIILPDGQTIIGSRAYRKNGANTSLFGLDKNGKAVELLELPSGNDTSYPGFIIVGNELWVSYYSGHEGRTSIYLAKMKYKDLHEYFEPVQYLKGLKILPDPSIDRRSFAAHYSKHKELWDKAFDFLQNTDLATLTLGRIELGNNMYATVSEYNPKVRDEQLPFEAHKKYIDIQYIVSGKELIDIVPLQNMAVTQPYNSETDAMFGTVTGFSELKASSDRFFIFFPADAHRPNLKDGEDETPVRKIVVKVPLKP